MLVEEMKLLKRRNIHHLNKCGKQIFSHCSLDDICLLLIMSEFDERSLYWNYLCMTIRKVVLLIKKNVYRIFETDRRSELEMKRRVHSSCGSKGVKNGKVGC